ncbi:MAG: diadenylate cyclase CdaA [Syntrophobacterales bacterium]|nr:MAG: diadenylate cyclase CdaA [Syntrophobacterales bacterium]
MNIPDILAGIRWQDIVDIVIVSVLIYWIIIFIKGTRAVQMIFGLALIIIAFYISRKGELLALHWILNTFWTSIIVLIIVIFQNDIRRALTTVGKNPFFTGIGFTEESHFFEDLIRASVSLANKRIGALIVFERNTGLREYIEGGIDLEAKVSKELIGSIFTPPSPLHDGAVIIRDRKIAAAGCLLPLSMDSEVGNDLGTRHRAAIGLTKETDAAVIIISEETGTISLALEGKITRNLDAPALRKILQRLFQRAQRTQKVSGKSGEIL